MRKYGRRAVLATGGGLVIKKRVEYVHDCEQECPNGHPCWSNVVLHVTEMYALRPINSQAMKN